MAIGSGNLWNPIWDLQLQPKLPEPEFRRLVQQNFRNLATQIQNHTVNVVTVPPKYGALQVGTGTKWTILPLGTEGQVLTVDLDAPYGIAWEDASVALNPFTDQIRRLLEGVVLELDEILPLLAALKIATTTSTGISSVGVDVNGTILGNATTLNFIAGTNVTIAGNLTGNTANLTFTATGGGGGGNGTALTALVENVSGGTVVIGQPVIMTGTANQVTTAQANNATGAQIIGLVLDVSIANAATGNIALGGPMTATTAEWDAVVTGESGGLTPGNVYYASAANAGKIANNIPDQTGSGNFAVLLGKAINPTLMAVNPAFTAFGY